MNNRIEKIKKFNADMKNIPERQRRHATRIIRPSKTLDYQVIMMKECQDDN